jgi:predicted nuclease of predicted toxin-antitoxin system
MRLLANENIGASVVQRLRDQGHDVVSVKESLRGSSDETILALARTEDRLVLTHDKDFGELAFRSGLAASGIILFRLSSDNPQANTDRILEVIASRNDWSGYCSVVTESRIRMRPLRAGS